MVHNIHFPGGGERVTVNMANHFAEKGDNISIISVSPNKTGNVFNINELVNIHYLNVDLNRGNKIVRKIESFFAVTKFFRDLDHPTFLLGMGNFPCLLCALLPHKDHLIKIGCQHGSYASVKHLWYILRWLFFRRLNAVVSLTNYDVHSLQKLNKTVCVIPNSTSFFPDRQAELQNKTILSIGRMDYPKGYDLLLEVFRLFCVNNKDWQLRIIGDGPLRETITDIINCKKLTDRVSIIPFSKTIIEEYLKVSIYLMTSRTEGLPMVLLEAQACGLPIIAFNCETGPADIINNGNDGYLINLYDINKMVSHLTELCTDFEKRKEFGMNARKNVRKFLPDQVFGKWEDLFARLQSKEKCK